jgi:hypothetical protein
VTIRPLDIVWSYTHGNDQLWLRRVNTEDGLLLVESCSDGRERSFFFTDFPALMRFQGQRVAHFEQAGWSLVGFSRERRVGFERRTARTGQDRRRFSQSRTA